MTQALNDVRKTVTESMQRVKEKLGLKEAEHSPRGTGEDKSPGSADGIKFLQDENAELHKQVCVWAGPGHVTVM